MMDSPRDLLPMGACENISWTSPNVTLLVSMAIFGKYLYTLLNFLLDGLLMGVRSWIEWRFLLQIPLDHGVV